MPAICLCANPLVLILDDFFGPEVAEAAIATGSPRLERAAIAGLGGMEVTEARTNRSALLDQWSEPSLAALVERISDVVRLPPEHCEPGKLLHYRGAEKFDPHFDAYGDFSPVEAAKLLEGGQRLFTTICYLNDVPEGGETVFPALSLAVRPKAGRLLVFGNTIAGSDERHPHAIHAGMPLKSGEKWIISFWWRQRLWHQPREYPESQSALLTY